MNRMQHTIDNLSNVIVGTKSARGRIEDADMAAETANLAKKSNPSASSNRNAWSSKPINANNSYTSKIISNFNNS